MRRKVLSLILVVTLMFSIITPAMAQGEPAKITQEQAMKIAKDTFNISESLKEVQIGYREEDYPTSRKVWEFSWSDSMLGRWQHYRVEVDADTGNILSYYEDQNWEKYKRPAKVKSEKECKVIAESFLKKIVPQKLNQLKEKNIPKNEYLMWDPYGPRRYNFAYERQVNGIPFPENHVNIVINADNGRVMQYYFNWSDTVEFPNSQPNIKVEDAEQIFVENVGLKLNYIQQYRYSPINLPGRAPIQLYYTLADSYGQPEMINAVTGKIIDQYGKESVKQKVYLPAKEEPAPVPKDQKLLTMEEAKEKVREYITIPDKFKARSSSYSEGWGAGSQKIWQFDFGQDNYGGGSSLNTGIDAVTGDLVSYHRWEERWDTDSNRKINYDYTKCKNVAVDFLKKVAPQKAEYTFLVEQPHNQVWISNGKAMDPPEYSFNFQRIVNGIPFPSNSLSVNVDNSTGEVRGFWSNWDQSLKFADNQSIITEQQAIDKLFEVEKPNLVYTYKLNEDGLPSTEVMLVYRFFTDTPKMVEAATGKVTSFYEMERPGSLEDITGHWAEREVTTLSTWGIIAGTNNKFYADRPITRAEFVNMLVIAKGLEIDKEAAQTFKDVPKTAWYFGAVEAAVKAGLVKGSGGKFNPNKPITRQEVVTMLVNSVGETISQNAPAEVLAGFKDKDKVAVWAQRYVSQAIEMGILTGQDGYLKPQANASRAEAAVLLFKLIENSERFGRYGSRVVYG